MEDKLPKSVFVVQNPEGKFFNDSITTQEHHTQQEFCRSWFSSWNIYPDGYESSVIWGMFKKRGFKIIEVPLNDIKR